MKRNNQKRGFTIVELVIVIAVIAILAAVLIPTYANLVKKANEAAALSDAKNLVTEMLANILSGGDDAADLVIVTKKGDEAYIHGYDVSDGRVVAYVNNPVQLGSEDGFAAKAEAICEKLVTDSALKKVTGEIAEWRTSEKLNGEGGTVATLGFKPDEMAVFADYTIEANFTEGAGTEVSSSNIASAVANGGKVVLSEDVTLSDTLTIAKETIIDLNGKTLANTADKYTIQVEKGAKLTIKGGTVKNDKDVGSSLIDNFGTLIIIDGTFTGSGSTIVKNESGATLTINGGTFTLNNPEKGNNTILNCGYAVINDGSFTSAGGAAAYNFVNKEADNVGKCTLVINGGKFESTMNITASSYAVANMGGVLEVTNGEFVSNTICVYSTATIINKQNIVPKTVFHGGSTIESKNSSAIYCTAGSIYINEAVLKGKNGINCGSSTLSVLNTTMFCAFDDKLDNVLKNCVEIKSGAQIAIVNAEEGTVKFTENSNKPSEDKLTARIDEKVYFVGAGGADIAIQMAYTAGSKEDCSTIVLYEDATKEKVINENQFLKVEFKNNATWNNAKGSSGTEVEKTYEDGFTFYTAIVTEASAFVSITKENGDKVFLASVRDVFKTKLSDNDYIKLLKSDTKNTMTIRNSNNVTIDLNGNSIFKLDVNNSVTIKDSVGGGTVLNTTGIKSNTTIEGGTFKFLTVSSGVKLTIKGGTYNKLTIYGTITAEGGTFSSDPTSYVDIANYNVVKDETAGTWTVTKK